MTQFRFTFEGILEADDQHKGEEIMEEFAKHQAILENYDYDVIEIQEEKKNESTST